MQKRKCPQEWFAQLEGGTLLEQHSLMNTVKRRDLHVYVPQKVWNQEAQHKPDRVMCRMCQLSSTACDGVTPPVSLYVNTLKKELSPLYTAPDPRLCKKKLPPPPKKINKRPRSSKRKGYEWRRKGEGVGGEAQTAVEVVQVVAGEEQDEG